MIEPSRQRLRHALPWLLGSVALLCAALMWLLPAIPQPQDYHHFADQRPWLGISNGADTFSNLPFVLFGCLGLLALWREPLPGALSELRPAYACFFAGAALTGLGSAWYHMDPRDATLVWDRLPMSISFMAFFCILIGEHIDTRSARSLLLPLMLLGVASVLYWYWSERAGSGDLRPYLLVQFVPLLTIPLILLTLPSRFTSVAALWVMLGLYVAAKLMELADHALFTLGHIVSGHTLKHLLAALAVLVFLRALRQRQLRSDSSAGLTEP